LFIYFEEKSFLFNGPKSSFLKMNEWQGILTSIKQKNIWNFPHDWRKLWYAEAYNEHEEAEKCGQTGKAFRVRHCQRHGIVHFMSPPFC